MLNSEQRAENVHFSFLPKSEFYLPNYGNWHPLKNFLHSFSKYLLRTHFPRQWGYPLNERYGPCPQRAHSLADEANMKSNRMSNCTSILVKWAKALNNCSQHCYPNASSEEVLNWEISKQDIVLSHFFLSVLYLKHLMANKIMCNRIIILVLPRMCTELVISF